jgi:cell division protein FtsN
MHPSVPAPPPAATPAQAAATPPPPVAKPVAKTPDKGDPIDALIAKADKPKAPAPAIAGAAVVQIGAFSSEALADREWGKAAGVAPGAMAGKGKRVVAVTRDDGATLYRTSITGFASRDDAVALCDKLKAAGGSCFVR